MKKSITTFLFFLFAVTLITQAQDHTWANIDTNGFYKKQVIKKGGFVLTFINKDSAFNAGTEQRMINLFFKVYPEEMKRFNPQSVKEVTFVISSEYTGVAATVGSVIKFNPAWLAKNPEDIDCATHELMHVVQAYGRNGNNPGWLVEGIADYARNAFGINNVKSNWALTPYKPGQMYTDAYRVTARFLTWVEKRYNTTMVDKLDQVMRSNQYNDQIWDQLTGKPVDELWYLYTMNPAI